MSHSIYSYDAILHAGDLGYNLDSYSGKMGDDFFNSIQDLVSEFPYMTIPGNHESNLNFTHYRGVTRTPMRSNGFFYSFDLGAAHFVMMDSEAFVGRFHTDLMLE
jgi:hypothetical protein